MNTLLQIQPLLQQDSPFTSIAKIVVALCATAAIISFFYSYIKGIEKFKIAAKMILVNELQLLIDKLPLNVDSFDRIIVEFSKLELTENQEDGLWQVFMTRFEKYAKQRETTNHYTSTRLKSRLENRRKSIESELNDIIKDREKTKSLFDRQQTNAKEQVLILLLNEYNDLLANPEVKKEPEKAVKDTAPAKVKKEKKVVEALTLTL